MLSQNWTLPVLSPLTSTPDLKQVVDHQQEEKKDTKLTCEHNTLYLNERSDQMQSSDSLPSPPSPTVILYTSWQRSASQHLISLQKIVGKRKIITSTNQRTLQGLSFQPKYASLTKFNNMHLIQSKRKCTHPSLLPEKIICASELHVTLKARPMKIMFHKDLSRYNNEGSK